MVTITFVLLVNLSASLALTTQRPAQKPQHKSPQRVTQRVTQLIAPVSHDFEVIITARVFKGRGDGRGAMEVEKYSLNDNSDILTEREMCYK